MNFLDCCPTLIIGFLLFVLVLRILTATGSEGFNSSSPPIHPLKNYPKLWPTQGLIRPVFGYTFGHGNQVPSYGPEGVLSVHPSKYEIQKAYRDYSQLVYDLDEKERRGERLTIPESFKYANATHMLNKLQGYSKPYFY